MKKVFAGLLLFVLAAAVLPAYAKRAEEVEVLIHKQVTAKSGMKITFVEMVEDSRCPVDVECVWAGNAKIKVRITKGRKSKVLELNTTLGNSTLPTYAGYRFKLKGLTPELRSNVRINRNAYKAMIEVTKVK